MSDRLKDFIRNNKKHFDQAEVPGGLWDKIEAELDAKEKSKPLKDTRIISIRLLLKIAATFAFIAASGLLFLKYQKDQASAVSSISPKLAKQQFQYASLIQEKRGELKSIAKEDPQLYSEFASELKTIDENYKKLKNDLITSPNQEETVKAMIRNLQVQLDVLNQQLQIIEQVKYYKNTQNNETQGI